jgi:hypothetical protein
MSFPGLVFPAPCSRQSATLMVSQQRIEKTVSGMGKPLGSAQAPALISLSCLVQDLSFLTSHFLRGQRPLEAALR